MPKASMLSRPVSAMERNSPDFIARKAWLWISVAASIWPATSAPGRFGAWISTCFKSPPSSAALSLYLWIKANRTWV